ncbi:hypothetical protein WCLP8_4240012 [uncultured Gammaproteobacteria bacterium]
MLGEPEKFAPGQLGVQAALDWFLREHGIFAIDIPRYLKLGR